MDLAAVILLLLVMVPVALLASGPLRVVLAAAFLVFLPGYALVAALFPRKDSLELLERITLSLVLSLAIVPLLGMVLNYTPWGIDTYPVVATVLGFVLLCSWVALWRRYRLPPDDRFRLPIPSVIRLPGGTRLDKVLAGALALAVLGALGTLVYVIAFPRDVEEFSEFYLLGSEGMMQHYPQEAIAGQPVVVTVAVANREQAETEYVVEASINGEPVSRTDPILLANDGAWEGEVSIIPAVEGPDQRVDLRLYKNGGADPYLSLHLMLDVRASP